MSEPQPTERSSREPDYGRLRAGDSKTARRQKRSGHRGRSKHGFGERDDHDPPEKGDFRRSPELANVEAILFTGREPLSGRKIAQLAGLAEGGQVRTLIRQLNALYDAAGTVFRVEEVAGGFQLHTRPKFAPWLRRLQAPTEPKLSGPAMETLGVVAYRQPILRAEIEAVRGVQCGDILRQLMERDLVRIVGRSDDLGRPLQYGTTKRFLELFGLRHIDELPRAVEFRGNLAIANQPSDTSHNSEPNLDASRADETLPKDGLSEDESVTMRIGSASVGELAEPSLLLRREADRRRAAVKPLSAAKDEEEDDETEEEEEDDDWEDDDEDDSDEEDEDEDDDFVDEDWEEVDDEDEDEEDEDDDEEWDDDEEDDEDWEDDEDEDEDEEELDDEV